MIISTVFLSIIQAITEFLPISSSGHLILARELFALNPLVYSLSFDIVLHLGTLLALIVYFWKDIKKVILNLFDKEKSNALFWNIFIGTIPALAIGFVFSDFIENSVRGAGIVVFNLIVIGFLFIIIENISKQKIELRDLGLKDALVIGFAQALALIPGVSRSGITIVIALFLGLKREDAAKFSFLLAIPAISLASTKGVYDLLRSDEGMGSWLVYAVGLIVSAIVGFVVIKYLLKYLKKNSLKPFAYYRFLIALIVLFMLWS